MLSLSQLKLNLFPVFKLVRRTGIVLEIAYKGKVYDMYIKETNKVPHLSRAKKARKTAPIRDILTIDNCELCGSVRVAGICMDKRCQSASTSSSKDTA